MWPNSQETAKSVTFTEEIFNEKLHFLCSDPLSLLCVVSGDAYKLYRTLPVDTERRLNVDTTPTTLCDVISTLTRRRVSTGLWSKKLSCDKKGVVTFSNHSICANIHSSVAPVWMELSKWLLNKIRWSPHRCVGLQK